MRFAGTSVSGAYKVCIASSGEVETVDVVTAIPDADPAIMATIRLWRFKPQAAPVCFVQPFEFEIAPSQRTRRESAPPAPTPLYGRYDPIEDRYTIRVSEDENGRVRADQIALGFKQILKQAALERAQEKDPRWAAQAESNYERELAAAEQNLGPEHIAIVPWLLRLARISVTLNKNAVADRYFRRALAISEKSLGPEHSQSLSVLDQMADFYLQIERYGDAAELRVKELVFIEKQDGPESPEVVRGLERISKLFLLQGRFDEAEVAAQRMLAIREKKLGSDSLQVAHSLTALAEIYIGQGKYSAAEPLAKRALAMFERGQRTNSFDIVPTLRALAILLRQQGEALHAEPYYKRALAITEKALDPMHPEVANQLNGLACFYLGQDQYALAEPLLKRALSIREELRGPNHSDVANILHNLSFLSVRQGKLAQAEQLSQRVIAIQERTLGADHPELAQGYAGLAVVYWNQGQYAQAESLLKRALVIQERGLGPEHPDVAETLSALAKLAIKRGKKKEALPLLHRSLRISETALSQAASEPRTLSLLTISQPDAYEVNELLLAPDREPELLPLALSLSLLRKGRAAEAGEQVNRAISSSLSTAEQKAAFAEWQQLRARREQLFLAGYGALSTQEYQRRFGALSVRIESLEQGLAAASPRLRSLKAPRLDEVLGQVAAKLPQGGALLEVVRTRRISLDSPMNRVLPDGDRYIAMLLFPDQRIEFADLGETRVIDQAVDTFLALLRAPENNPLPAAQGLYQKLLQPLERHLAGVSQLYLSLDGTLNFVPYTALHNGKQYLLDRYQLHYLTSGRDLLREPTAPSSRPALILADPDFGKAPVENTTSAAPPVEKESIVNLYALFQELTRLPATRKEAQTLAQLLPHAEVRLDQAATEQTLRQGEAPRIIHIATHGLFLALDAQSLQVPAQDFAQRGFQPVERTLELKTASQSTRIWKLASLSRSSLALAGAAYAAQSPSTEQDGILTAEEVRSMNLSGTELVVLSACDTGVGSFRFGEGVSGLRRSFLIAGAQTLVASLWSVADVETGELMRLYYARLIKQGKPRVAAMQEAMKEMRKRKPHPYYWAPFIVIGQDGPLTRN